VIAAPVKGWRGLSNKSSNFKRSVVHFQQVFAKPLALLGSLWLVANPLPATFALAKVEPFKWAIRNNFVVMKIPDCRVLFCFHAKLMKC